MSFTKLETGLWFVFAWISIKTYSFANLSVVAFLYFFLFGKVIKNDYTRSFLRNFR